MLFRVVFHRRSNPNSTYKKNSFPLTRLRAIQLTFVYNLDACIIDAYSKCEVTTQSKPGIPLCFIERRWAHTTISSTSIARSNIKPERKIVRTSVWLASSLEIRVEGIHFSRVVLTIIHKCVQTRERTNYLQRLPPHPWTHYIRRDLSRISTFPVSLSLHFYLFLMASSTPFNAGFLFPHRGKRMARFVLASHSWVLYEKASTKRSSTLECRDETCFKSNVSVV